MTSRSVVDRSLRIRLEGRVEELERAITRWEEAVFAARRNDFTCAADMLERGEVSVPAREELGLRSLVERQEALRRELAWLVTNRLRMFGVPAIDVARGARWLTTEPVRYEHHRLTLAFLHVLWLPLLLLFPMAAIARSIDGAFGLVFFASCTVTAMALTIRRFGWSDVVLTDKKMLVEGRMIDLEGVTRVVVVRTISRQWPAPVRLELRSERRELARTELRHFSDELRGAFERMGIELGFDWSLF